MADDTTTTTTQPQPPRPNPDLQGLDRLVGIWNVAGGAQGQVPYQWMDGGFFLLQHVELEQYGQRSRASRSSATSGPSAPSRARRSPHASTTAWGTPSTTSTSLRGTPSPSGGGERGSPAYYQGRFSEDGNTVTGEWVYPGGGGYHSTATRVGRSRR